MTSRFARRLPFRLVQRFGRRVDTTIGTSHVSIPVWDAAALAWIYWQPGWLAQILRPLLRGRPAAFLDVGANVGQSLAAFLSAGTPARYVGFEPNARCVAFLQDLIHASSLQRVDLVPAGLWHETGLAVLNLGSAADQTASLRTDLRPSLARHQEWIATVALDRVAATLAIEDVACIKMDVEGVELEALQGMSDLLTRTQPLVVCEVLRRDPAADPAAYAARVSALRGFLREHGYQILRCEVAATGRLHALEPVTAFPLEPWTPACAGQCDYLFVPDSFPRELLHSAIATGATAPRSS